MSVRVNGIGSASAGTANHRFLFPNFAGSKRIFTVTPSNRYKIVACARGPVNTAAWLRQVGSAQC